MLYSVLQMLLVSYFISRLSKLITVVGENGSDFLLLITRCCVDYILRAFLFLFVLWIGCII